jgi:hypothetical protein
MKRLGLAFAFCALLFGAASAQLSGGLMFPGPGTPHTSATYTGPGDSQTFILWGSVARVYNLAKASTSTSLADLVDSSAPTTVICTLRGSTAGTVDLTGTYCTGSVTPATKCAAATGGKCNVSKLYDQVGTNNWVQTTAAKQPTLTFSAINGLPAMTFVSASAQTLISGSVTSTAEPYTFEGVGERTANFSTKQAFITNNNGGGASAIWADSSATFRATLAADLNSSGNVPDSAFHVLQTAFNSTSSTVNVDGATQVAGDTGAAQNLSSFIDLGSVADVTQYLDGKIAEAGVYAGTYSSGVQSNARNASTGYGL